MGGGGEAKSGSGGAATRSELLICTQKAAGAAKPAPSPPGDGALVCLRIGVGWRGTGLMSQYKPTTVHLRL